MSNDYQTRLERFKKALYEAEVVIIGAGAGLSTSAGIKYSGKRFEDNFPEYIKKYGLTDMYSSAFFPFKTQEERWGYWSRHVYINSFALEACELYLKLKDLVDGKNYRVLTTNADGQFYEAGFDPERIFAPQGDYTKIQCATGCHPKLYDVEDAVKRMMAAEKDCRVPTELIPVCPNCGGPMDSNIRKDQYFVEDEAWHQSAQSYQQFLSTALEGKKILLLELGVGYNTPVIIKYPFEQLTSQHDQATLVRINLDWPEVGPENEQKTIAFGEDISEVVNDLLGEPWGVLAPV